MLKLIFHYLFKFSPTNHSEHSGNLNILINISTVIIYTTFMAEKQKAAGSIWNVNSWHWEMKNYTELTKKIL